MLPTQQDLNYLYSGDGYLFPRSDHVVIGGTYEPDLSDETPSQTVCKDILKYMASHFGVVPAVPMPDIHINHPDHAAIYDPVLPNDHGAAESERVNAREGTMAITVVDYVLTRLKEQGVTHLFGVPALYCAALFDGAPAHGITPVVTASDLEAGYAADGYARTKGLGRGVGSQRRRHAEPHQRHRRGLRRAQPGGGHQRRADRGPPRRSGSA